MPSHLIQRALRINDSEPELWVAYFRFELVFLAKLRARREQLGLEVEGDKLEDADEDGSDAGMEEEDEEDEEGEEEEEGEEAEVLAADSMEGDVEGEVGGETDLGQLAIPHFAFQRM